MKVTIRTLTRESRGFYALMGPYLAQRAIARELGGALWDDEGIVWFVATDETGAVLGFCALLQRGERAELRHSYVLPGRRRAGVYRLLFEARLAAIRAPATARSVVRKEAAAVFRNHGFRAVRKTANFTTFEKAIR